MNTDVRIGQRIQNITSSQIFPAHKRSECLMRCSVNASCLSINFCQPNICELNAQDILTSWKESTAILISEPNCIYIGMRFDSQLRCNIGGKEVGESNDTGSQEICGMKSCGEMFEFTVIDNQSEWKVVRRLAMYYKTYNNI